MCVYVRMCVRTCVFVCICVSVHIYVHVCACVYGSTVLFCTTQGVR